MTDSVWRSAATAEDFVLFRKNSVQEQKSRFSVFRTPDTLMLGFFFSELPENRVKSPDLTDGNGIWESDMAEIHFGGMEPEPWLLQLGIGIGGGRFDSSGQYDSWKAHVFENSEGWGAEVQIPLSMLRLTEGALKFNLCRQSLRQGMRSTWNPLLLRFHEVENFGQLLFTDYVTALQLRGGNSKKTSIGRDEFEQLCSSLLIPAQKVVHGPYLSNPDRNSVCITWETAGRVPAFLEYRPKGSAEKAIRIPCDRQNGILLHNTLHFAQLTALDAGKDYEYELFSLTPVTGEVKSSGIVRSFRIPDSKDMNFSFFCLSDLHSNVGFLRNALKTPEAGQAAFHVLLGDNLSHAAGREALYEGVLDPIVTEFKQGKMDKPLIFTRGNHEQLGVYASEYFQVMRHETGRSFHSFHYGNMFFIVLDSGNDATDTQGGALFSNTELLRKQRLFLEKTICSPSYRNAAFRVILLHIPPFRASNPVEKMIYDMLQPLRDAEIPPDLMLSGHIHRYLRVNAGAMTFDPASDQKWAAEYPAVMPLPCTVIVCSTSTALDCKATQDALEIKAISPIGNAQAWRPVDEIRIPRRKHEKPSPQYESGRFSKRA